MNVREQCTLVQGRIRGEAKKASESVGQWKIRCLSLTVSKWHQSRFAYHILRKRPRIADRFTLLRLVFDTAALRFRRSATVLKASRSDVKGT
jgi:hypothetical protein